MKPIWPLPAPGGQTSAIIYLIYFSHIPLSAGLQHYTRNFMLRITFRSIMQHRVFDFWYECLQNQILQHHNRRFCELNYPTRFVLCEMLAVCVSKPKQAKSTKKREKTGKTTFFAFFPAKGKDDEIRAILRESQSYISRFISADKVQNQPSWTETK